MGFDFSPPGSSTLTYTDIYEAPAPATTAADQVATDTANFKNIIASGRTIKPLANKTYLINGRLTLPSNFRLSGFYATLKIPDQRVFTTTAPTTVSVGATSAVFTVGGSLTGMFETMGVCVEDRTISPVRVFAANDCTIPSGGISGSSITVNFSGGFIGKSYNTSTNAEGNITTSYTFPTGTVIASMSQILTAYGNTANICIEDLTIDCNSANNPYGNRWEIAAGASIFSDSSTIRNIYINTSLADALVVSGEECYYENIHLVAPNGSCMHYSDGSLNHSVRSITNGLFCDSPGMGATSYSGHWGGSTNNPSFGGVICSSNEYEHIINNWHVKNSYNSKKCSGMTHINGDTNKDLTLYSGKVRDMTHGAFEIRNNTATNQAPANIFFRGLDVLECSPATAAAKGSVGASTGFAGAPIYANNTTIGYNTGNSPLAKNVRLENAYFENSPLIIQGAVNVELNNVTLDCTNSAKSSSLVVLASGSTRSQVITRGVTVRAPIGNLSSSRSGWFDEYLKNVYINGSDIQGEGFTSIGGNEGAKVVNGALVDVDSITVFANYDYGYNQRNSTTITRAGKFTERNPATYQGSAITHSSSHIGCNANQSGTDDGIIDVKVWDINNAAQSTTEIGINLSSSATSYVRMGSGSILMKGAATGKAFNNGNATSKNEFGNVWYDAAAYVPGSADVGLPRRLGTPGTPTIAAGAGAGTSPSGVTVTGTDGAFNVSFTTGTTPSANAVIATITLSANYGKAPGFHVSPANGNAASSAAYGSTTTSTFVLNSSTALTAATAYSFEIILKDKSQDLR